MGCRLTAKSAGTSLPPALRLKAAIAAEQFLEAARRFGDLLGKANFNRNQPRVPSGTFEGGRWTDWDRAPVEPLDPEIWLNEPNNERPQLILVSDDGQPPPHIPKERPPTKVQNAIVKRVARYVSLNFLPGTPIDYILKTIEVAVWLNDHIPRVESFRDPPKSLEELQRAVSDPRAGYDKHHLNEQTPARQAGFSEAEIESPDNLVLIPTLKHWQITGWYATPNPQFGLKSPDHPNLGWNSPRDYLRDKSWEERRRVGLEALRYFKVLTP